MALLLPLVIGGLVLVLAVLRFLAAIHGVRPHDD